MDIVFMGTPDFAVASLKRLIEDGHNILGVYTKPDKLFGRHQTLSQSQVKLCALSHGLDVYQPESFKDEAQVDILRRLSPELIVVVAYGKILPQQVLNIPKLGCVNVHGSLLPRYRGAAPIQWTVLNGDSIGGVTTMYMDAGLDTGDIILMSSVPVGENETSGELFDTLCVSGAQLLSETVALISEGKAPRAKQDDSEATYAPMLDKSMSIIDWTQPNTAVHNIVRGLSPWPVAVAFLGKKRVKILKTTLSDAAGSPGQVVSLSPLTVACGTGAVQILSLQPEGKRVMESADFLLGHRLAIGDLFE